jgi:purine-nucleoside phosphorylase
MTALLLAAFPPELGPLHGAPPVGWVAACTGVGAIQAAAATAALVAEHRPDRVLFVGTCGAYDDRLPLGALLAAREAIAASVEELQGRAYRPGIEPTRWLATWPLPLEAVDVVVPPAITATAEGAQLLGVLGAVEHLELTGVFAACHRAGIPCAGALVVVNEVGPEAHVQWREHHAEGSRALIAQLLAAGVFETA